MRVVNEERYHEVARNEARNEACNAAVYRQGPLLCLTARPAQCRCLPSVDATIKWALMLRHLLKDDTVSEFNLHGLSRYGCRVIASAVGRSVFTPHVMLLSQCSRRPLTERGRRRENPAPRPTPVLAFPTPPKGLDEALTPEEYGTQRDRTTVRHEHIEDVLADKAVRTSGHAPRVRDWAVAGCVVRAREC